MAENKIQERKINHTLVLKAVRENPGISRIDIARELGLNRSTITHIVSGLIEAEILTEQESLKHVGTRGGRRPIGLELNPRTGLIIGVEWQVDFFRYILTDLSGNLRGRGTREIRPVDRKDFLQALAESIRFEESRTGLPVLGAGLGVPGLVNPYQGEVLRSLPLGLRSCPMVQEAEDALGLPVAVENDANCFAWGEIQERSRDMRNFICLMLEFHFLEDGRYEDQEVGMGIVQDRSVYYGASYSAGELNTELVGKELKSRFHALCRSRSRQPVPDDRTAVEYFSSLFRALKPIVAVLDPEEIILGGEFLQYREPVEQVLREEWGSGRGAGGAMPGWDYSSREEYEVAFGAASHFIEKMFTLPSWSDDQKENRIGWDLIINRMES